MAWAQNLRQQYVGPALCCGELENGCFQLPVTPVPANQHRSTGHVFCVMSAFLRGQAQYQNPPRNQTDGAGPSGLPGGSTAASFPTEAKGQPHTGRTLAEMQSETSAGLASVTASPQSFLVTRVVSFPGVVY